MLERIRALAIPPGWEDVWICADPLGHIQATGVDARGRKQYRYHDRWRERRDREKFDRMVEFARRLPRLRRRVERDLRRRKLSRERVLAFDPRVFDRFDGGLTVGGVFDRLPEDPADWPEIQGPIERAVLDLIDRRESPSVERV